MTSEAGEAPPPVPSLSSGRRWLVRGLVTLATVIGIFAVFAVWANRQVLDADNWADTSSQLLENQAIRTQVADYLVDSVYTNVDVTGEFRAAFPPRLDPLAGPAANAIRQLAEKRTVILLDRPRIQNAWETANRVTAQQFIDIAEGNSRAIGIRGNAVVLNVRQILLDLVRQLGGSGKLAGKIPPDAGRITIMNSDQVKTLQNGVNGLQGLSAVLPGLALVLYALAVYLSPGRRRRVLAYAGGGFIVAGIVVLVGRNLAGNYVVDSLAKTAAVQPAAEAAWSIGTQMLRDVAQASIIIGIPVVIAAWLSGPMRPAVALRRAAAPWLRERPGLCYGILAAALLLVVAWGPIPATRMVLPVLLMVGLATAGLAVLRRQVAEEFPDVTTSDVGASLRGGATRAVRAVSTARAGNGAPVAAAADAADAPPVAGHVVVTPQASTLTRVEQLERLAALHDSGALSDAEFAAEKTNLDRREAVR
jgi:Short C-terminal domain